MKSLLFSAVASLYVVCSASGANYAINNVVAGPGDVLYADAANAPLTGSIVTLGIFTEGFDVQASVEANDISALIDNFTIITSALTGNYSVSLGGNFAGYVEGGEVDGSLLIGSDPLIGVTLYSFVGNASTLEESTSFALLNMYVFVDEEAGELDYSANPLASPYSPLIGEYDSVTGDYGAGEGTYGTLKLAAIPEPSTALLGALGALGLLRRRR
jgi:hypothetical protein